MVGKPPINKPPEKVVFTMQIRPPNPVTICCKECTKSDMIRAAKSNPVDMAEPGKEVPEIECNVNVSHIG
jgi:hypothetical protein